MRSNNLRSHCLFLDCLPSKASFLNTGSGAGAFSSDRSSSLRSSYPLTLFPRKGNGCTPPIRQRRISMKYSNRFSLSLWRKCVSEGVNAAFLDPNKSSTSKKLKLLIPSEIYLPIISLSSVTVSRKQLSYSQTPTPTFFLPTAITGWRCTASKHAAAKSASCNALADLDLRMDVSLAAATGEDRSVSPAFSILRLLIAANTAAAI